MQEAKEQRIKQVQAIPECSKAIDSKIILQNH
uniref:Uncharacterized protein n=1 Tax=Anguilla anguilla TaxID=7936 RepID=A0A0E9VFV3_ANGAN